VDDAGVRELSPDFRRDVALVSDQERARER
jgi:hypothetical protein